MRLGTDSEGGKVKRVTHMDRGRVEDGEKKRGEEIEEKKGGVY